MPARARQPQLLFTAAVAALCALAITACGSAAGKPSAGQSGTSQLIAFSRCMRSHGVPSFPDPSGHGLNLAGTGIDPAAPSFRAAQATCTHLLPGGGPGNQKPSKAQVAQAVRAAQCMRAHGVSGFPDPKISTGSGPPEIEPARYSLVEDDNGLITAIPRTIDIHSPAFRHAAKACGFN